MTRALSARDFSPRRRSADLIWALSQLKREDDARAPWVIPLLEHREPDVRSEAISVVFVLWRLREHRAIAKALFSQDRDESVRARAAYAIAATSGEETSREDAQALVAALENASEAPEVRRAAYVALGLMFRRPQFPDTLGDFDPDRDVDWEWIDEIRTLYA